MSLLVSVSAQLIGEDADVWGWEERVVTALEQIQATAAAEGRIDFEIWAGKSAGRPVSSPPVASVPVGLELADPTAIDPSEPFDFAKRLSDVVEGIGLGTGIGKILRSAGVITIGQFFALSIEEIQVCIRGLDVAMQSKVLEVRAALGHPAQTNWKIDRGDRWIGGLFWSDVAYPLSRAGVFTVAELTALTWIQVEEILSAPFDLGKKRSDDEQAKKEDEYVRLLELLDADLQRRRLTLREP